MTSNLPAEKKKIPEGLAYHLALNRASVGMKLFEDEEIAADYDLSVAELHELMLCEELKQQVLICLRDIKENGDSVRLKARVQFEHYLDTYPIKLFNDSEASHAEKVKLLAFLAKVSGIDEGTSKGIDATISQNNVPQLRIFLSAAPNPAVQQPQEKVINVIDNQAP